MTKICETAPDYIFSFSKNTVWKIWKYHVKLDVVLAAKKALKFRQIESHLCCQRSLKISVKLEVVRTATGASKSCQIRDRLNCQNRYLKFRQISSRSYCQRSLETLSNWSVVFSRPKQPPKDETIKSGASYQY